MAEKLVASSGKVFPLGEVRRYPGKSSPEVERYPFYKYVPKDDVEQLKFRLYVRLRCLVDQKFREAIYEMCRQDMLFWINTMCWCFEPRPKPRDLILNTWPDQDFILACMDECFGVRDCIAGGSLVVTDRGLVPIEEVTSADKVWDGEEWVSQGGAISRGRKPVMSAYGVRLTPDHKVLTNAGWQNASCGYDREEVRPPDGYREAWNLQEKQASGVAMPVRVRESERRSREQSSARLEPKLWLQAARGVHKPSARPSGESRSQCLAWHEAAVSVPNVSGLSAIRRAWDQGVRALAVIRGILAGHGAARAGHDLGADRQRWGLLPRKLPVGFSQGTGKQYSPESLVQHGSRAENTLRDCKNRWGKDGLCGVSLQSRNACERPAEPENLQEAEVYDLINCGPRNRFTLIGKDGRLVVVHNCGVEKSRGVGASWNIVALSYHKWEFESSQSATAGVAIGFVSRTEDAVDSRTDSDTLMWKLDYLYKMMPVWMRVGRDGKPKLSRNYDQHRFQNKDNNSAIFGYAATADVATGGRKSAMFMDEFGKFGQGKDQAALDSTQYVTNCRYFISTYLNDTNAFYRLMQDKTSMLKLIVDWKDNPDRAAGLYKVHNGKIEILDKNYVFPDDYPFETDPMKGGFIRSPWYDAECRRPGATARSIAREIDRDARGASSKVFATRTIQKAETQIRTPSLRGEMQWDDETYEPNWTEQGNGKLCWWDVPISGQKVGFSGPYVIGCDVAWGTAGDYSSNSAMVVIDATKRSVVGEYVSNAITPHDFCRMVVATMKFLAGGRGEEQCYLIWENQGPGTGFWQELKRIGWSNYYTRRGDVRDKTSKFTKKAGWWNTSRELELCFNNLQDAILNDRLIIPAERAIRELSEYEFDNSGKIVHVSSERSEDGSAKSAAHGDAAIALALAFHAFNTRVKSYKNQVAKSVDGKLRQMLELDAQIERERKDSRMKSYNDFWEELVDDSMVTY